MIRFKSYLFAFLALVGVNDSLAQSNSSLDEAVLGAMARENIPGLSIAVVSDGEQLLKSYGERRADSGLVVNNDTIFEAASLSKPVFALLVLQLEAEGLIDLDRPLHEYIEDSDDFGSDFFESEEYRLITASMVLSHVSGLPKALLLLERFTSYLAHAMPIPELGFDTSMLQSNK